MKRLTALFLVFAILFALHAPVFAIDSSTQPIINNSETSFIDSEGKVNTVYITIPTVGSSHVEYYIDGELLNTVDATLCDLHSATTASTNNTGYIQFVYTDAQTSCTEQFSAPLSDYIATTPSVSATSNITPASMNAYIYDGQIHYNTYYDNYGNVYNDSVSIYKETLNTREDYRMVNGAAGDAVSIIISAVASVLTVICPKLAELADSVVFAILSATGVSVIGGNIQSAISERYYARTTYFNIKASNDSYYAERYYTAERYQILLPGGEWSSSYRYVGYLPWDESGVASMIFGDFWGYPYPGVDYYSY